MERTNKKLHSLKHKILFRFVIILTIILAIIWIMQVILYDDIYRKIKTQELKSLNSAVVTRINNAQDGNIELPKTVDCNIVIFQLAEFVDRMELYVLYPQPTQTEGGIVLRHSIEDFLTELGTQPAVEYTRDNYSFTTLTLGEKVSVGGQDLYVYISGTVTPTGSTQSVLSFTLLIITIMGFAITIILSVLFSETISKPIKKISESAEELSKGNLDVEFDSDEYTEVKNLSDTLNYSVLEIKKSRDLQREVIQNVSHELRTPLTMIESYAQLLKEFSAEDKVKRKEHLDIIIEESKKLDSLINDLIDLSKLQSKTMEYHDEVFDLCDSLRKMETYYKQKFGKAGFEFTFKYPKSVKICADKIRIEQVMTNFINNAINYLRENKKVNVTLAKTGEKYSLSVQDYGIGISENDISQVFDRHFRSTNTKRAVVGSGIGLTIVKEVLEYYNFEYGAQSKLNEGSTFYFKFEEYKKPEAKKTKKVANSKK